MKSPCVKVCQMDPARALCTGCLRTLDEIARWGAMPEEEREAIMADLASRRAQAPSDLPQAAPFSRPTRP